ncbi:uncharacterized protein LOC131016626 isoform X2 [Salvia miltiorrhiza]|uniref:uncharacterized protein LOC131016626 isoform X2 n=1 Tax=Salvia miltiorrhiza TaxID=226208 RepID=UPI0025AD30DF|nr:uncharacterized protein LOC131016626 isoform X2 [Salvia miltiorrhiza]
METGKQSSSSFTSDLFGAKDSSSSSQILSSIFAPPAKVSGLENEKKNGSVTQASTAKTGEKEKRSYLEEEKTTPFHYSSSIYYGGQDVYSQPHSSSLTTEMQLNKDVGEDESDSASRGNWWQGSLYY